jgi:putative tryptophan/tyrosine transport system substrate-binding protein
MKRREFIAGLGGAVAWPLAAGAQQPTMSVQTRPGVTAIHKGLGEIGFIEGQNLAIEYRGASNQSGQLPVRADDLVRCRVAAGPSPLSHDAR